MRDSTIHPPHSFQSGPLLERDIMSKKRTIISPEASKSEMRNVTIGEGEPTYTGDQDNSRAILRAEQRKKFVTISDRLAEDTTYFRGHKWDIFNKYYPTTDKALMRFVTKYYPYAKGGALFVDEPKTEREYEMAMQKHEAMKELSLRYVVVGDTESFQECLEKLGEVDMELEKRGKAECTIPA